MLRALLLGLCFSFSSAQAEVSPLKKAVQLYGQKPNAESALSRLNDYLPVETRDFLKAKLPELGKDPLPTVQLKSQESVILSLQGMMVTVRFSPSTHAVFVNERRIDWRQQRTSAERFQAILGALPQVQPDTGLLDWILPKGHAQDSSALRITGGAGVITGATVIAAKLTNPMGWTILGLSAVTLNLGVCEDIKREVLPCLQTKSDLDRSLNKSRAVRLAYRAQRSPIHCRTEPPIMEENEAREVARMLNTLVSNEEEITRQWAVCPQDDRKQKLQRCLKEVSTRASYLCVQTYGVADKFIEPWAKLPTTDSLRPSLESGETAR